MRSAVSLMVAIYLELYVRSGRGNGSRSKVVSACMLLEGDKAEILQDFIAPFLASNRASTALGHGHEAFSS